MNETYQTRRAIFDQNLALCERKFPEVFERLMNTELTDRYEIFVSKHESGSLNIIDHKEQKLFYENDDPLASIAQHMEKGSKNLQGFVLHFGFGLGYGPLISVSQSNSFERAIFVYEEDPEVLLHAFYALDCSAILNCEDVVLIVGESPEEASSKIFVATSGNRIMNAKNIEIVELPASYSVYREEYLAHLQVFKEQIVIQVKSVGNLPSDNLLGIRNTLSNIDIISKSPGIAPLHQAFLGQPGIVVAAGPSLDKNIDLIKSLQGKAVIVSVDASLRMLREAGAFPDFVTSLERVPETARLFEGLKAKDFEQSTLVSPGVLDPQTYKNYQGSKILSEKEYAFTKWLDLQKGPLLDGPSSGNYAFSLLDYLGCDPIILVGQDLALGEGNATHAKHSFYGNQAPGYLNDLTEVDGNCKDKVTTNHLLNLFRKVYEQQVKISNSRVINATEGGAMIRGTDIAPLRVVIENLDLHNNLVDVEGTLAQLLQVPKTDESRELKESVKSKLREALKFFDSAKKEIEEAVNASSILKRFWDKAPLPSDPHMTPEVILSLKAKANVISSVVMDPIFQNSAMTYVQSTYTHHTMQLVERLSNIEPGVEKDQYVNAHSAVLSLGVSSMMDDLASIYEKTIEAIDRESELEHISPEFRDFATARTNGASTIPSEGAIQV